MKKLFLTLVLLVGIAVGLFAQKLTYQAVVRDNNQQLVVNTAVKATVTIAFSTGNPYTTEVNGSTNIHGLLSFEFGGDALNGRDWTNATIAVKVVKANDESTVYVNDGARPVSAVPYALSVNGQSIQNYLTEHHYVDQTELDSRHYLTSDSAVITTMQGNITTNANSIANLTLHTAKAAIRDSVAGQIHDSISNIAAKAHTHDNADILNNTTATYTAADSIKLKGIAAGAEVNVQSDWNQTTTTADGYIKNKPTIPTTVAELSDAGNYVKNADLTNLLNAMNAKIDSLAHIVDSLSNLTPGGGDTPTAFTCGTDSIKDVDNNWYHTVKIGNQCWTKENMKTTKYADDTSIENSKMFNPNDNEAYVATYGKLYTWSAATRDSSTTYPTSGNKVRGICPAGWHVPSNAEWDTLTNYVKGKTEYKCGGDAENIAKALASKTGWADNGTICNVGNTPGNNNATGFSAVPAGSSGLDYTFGSDACFWSATENGVGAGAVTAMYRQLGSNASFVDGEGEYKYYGYSVRCLRDAGVGGPAGGNEIAGTTPSAPATMSCDDVMECMGDTLGKLNEKIEAQGQTITTQGHTIDSLAHIVDSLSNLPHGGDTPTAFTCGTSKVKDADLNEYNTVKIGNQCWMAQNLRTKLGTEGDKGYPTGASNDTVTYGRLYTWDAVTKGASTNYPANPTDTLVHGICPAGWHVPSDAEWDTLTKYVYNSAEPDYKCSGCSSSGWEQSTPCIANALSSSTGWQSPSECAAGRSSATLNQTGFAAVPAGGCFNGSFSGFGYFAFFWSATQNDGGNAWCRSLNSYDSIVGSSNVNKDNGFSVRCLRD